MSQVILKRERVGEWVQSMMDAGDRVVGPVRASAGTLFAAIAKPADLTLGGPLPVKSAKGVFFPQSEIVMRYKMQGGAVSLENIEEFAPRTVLIGTRPCDAASLTILDSVFSWDYKDAFYLKRRERTTIVSLGCNEPQDDSCFCTSVGLGPDSRIGSDVFMRECASGDYLLESVTEKGEALLARTPRLFALADAAAIQAAAPKPPAVVPVKFEKDRLKPWLDEHFDDAMWAEMSLKCIGCGTCAFVCPACHCFDIVDETRMGEGVRRKNWDSCQFGLFTRHASGHNPRGVQGARYRQRIMHKFNYYVEKFGKTLCAGCGRCVRSCPVGHSLLDYLEEIDRRAAESEPLPARKENS